MRCNYTYAENGGDMGREVEQDVHRQRNGVQQQECNDEQNKTREYK